MAAAAAAAAKRKKKAGASDEAVPDMPEPEVLSCDMPEEDCAKVFRMAAVALDKEKIEKDQATYIKKELEKEFGGMWHCILGACYGVSVTNETKSLLFFKTGLRYVLVFRTLDEEKQAIENTPAPTGEGGDVEDDMLEGDEEGEPEGDE
ncbi:hypothetical protein FNF29_01384 [Cafeteria roenbergensis]|uniref:Dynein light chain n=1 Tax=Cafeteria roenbergensis TaxID=33653 RepID=A0A5A8E206_CAFRO|nr:hypothetical protein FNF29_01384 [Cafeteria roenbergensis]KAA0163640.1 hypothetical protein FNF31_02801 [Cafeteria roenbergensis]KAA0171826.1 hypothetical protein FNF28_00462 [Cafeteria roenbergensis]|eukprot:KAA0155965.1 hypothetical protein FNF29_01384 [Cafeteria roenbergensis]